jgi:hypothetical protein
MVAIVIAPAVPWMGKSCASPVEPRRSEIRLHFRQARSEEETMESTRFDGWPVEAPALLAQIAADNRADRWPELREGHAALVRGPTLALAGELAGEFGPVRVFRPHVTRRFRPDAPPLRTDTGGVATSPGGCGLAVVLSAEALTVTVGHWRFDRDQRSRYRAAVDAVESGGELAGLLRRLAADGLPADPEGELRILPRGWRADHPRIWLARRRGLQVVRRWELGPWVSTPEPLERVRSAWRAAAPLVGWLDTHVGRASPPAAPADPRRAATSGGAAAPTGPAAAAEPVASSGAAIDVGPAAADDGPTSPRPGLAVAAADEPGTVSRAGYSVRCLGVATAGVRSSSSSSAFVSRST